MTTYTLLEPGGPPDHLDTFTGALTNGTEFTLSSAATMTGIWVYSFSGAGTLPTHVGLFTSGGTLIFSDPSPTWSGAAGSGWVKYTTSRALGAGSYTVAAGNDSGGSTWYAITNSGWGPVTSGPLSCGSNPNTFDTSGSFAFPATAYGANNIWLDVEVSTGGTAHTATVSLTVTPSVSVARTRGKYRTVSVPVAPSVSVARTRGKYRTVAATVTPQVAVGRARGHYRTVSVPVAPQVAIGRSQAHVRQVLLSVIPRIIIAATGGQAKGERQLVRLAVAAYFGGTQATDGEVKFQGGPLAPFGLGTAYPYSVRHAPDTDYTAGAAAGRNWGVVMSTTRVRRTNVRVSYGGGTSGWRARKYAIECQLELLAELEHIEVAGAGLDDLIDQFAVMIAADRNLGTKAAYEAGTSPLLVIQAGEGHEGITDETDRFEAIDNKEGRYRGTATVAFEVLVMVAS